MQLVMRKMGEQKITPADMLEIVQRHGLPTVAHANGNQPAIDALTAEIGAL